MEDFLRVTADEFIPLRDVVFKTLRKAILRGDLAPGERLMEIHLAERMGVSRTPIREAIRMLELEGLVTMVPRKGETVAKITMTGLKDVLEVRVALHKLAIELACDRITKKQLENLKMAKEHFEKTVKCGDIVAIAEADVQFHDIIVEAANNQKLAQMVNNLSEQVYRYRYECVKDKNIHPELIREHGEMYDSLVSRDKKRAADIVQTHIHKQEKSIVAKLHLEEE